MGYVPEQHKREGPHQSPKPHARSSLKCMRCREMKLKCTPSNRVWPGIPCTRCERAGQPCGPNLTAKQARHLYSQPLPVWMSNSNDCTSPPIQKESEEKSDSRVGPIHKIEELPPVIDLTNDCPNSLSTNDDSIMIENNAVHTQQHSSSQGIEGCSRIPKNCFSRRNLGDGVDRCIEKLDYLLICRETLEGTKRLSSPGTLNEQSGSYVTLQFQWRKLIDEIEWTMVRLSDLADAATRDGYRVQADRVLTSLLDALQQCPEAGAGTQTIVLCTAVSCYRKIGSEPRMQKALHRLSALDARQKLDLEFDPNALLAHSLLKTSPVVASSFAGQGAAAIGTRVQCPALHESLRCENPQVFSEVLKLVREGKSKDPDEGLDSRDTLGRTPLLLAATLGDEETCNALIKADAKVDAADYDGHTILEIAARNNLLKTISALLKRGAKINQLSIRDGVTPLQAAAAQGHAQVVDYLLSHGAKEETTAVSTDKTVALLALENGHYNIVKKIDPWNPVQNSPNYVTCFLPDPSIVSFEDSYSEDSGYSTGSVSDNMKYDTMMTSSEPDAFCWQDQHSDMWELCNPISV